jgi:hypothetical protein
LSRSRDVIVDAATMDEKATNERGDDMKDVLADDVGGTVGVGAGPPGSEPSSWQAHGSCVSNTEMTETQTSIGMSPVCPNSCNCAHVMLCPSKMMPLSGAPTSRPGPQMSHVEPSPAVGSSVGDMTGLMDGEPSSDPGGVPVPSSTGAMLGTSLGESLAASGVAGAMLS